MSKYLLLLHYSTNRFVTRYYINGKVASAARDTRQEAEQQHQQLMNMQMTLCDWLSRDG